MNQEKAKLYEALIDAIQKSPHFNNIPLPAVIDNELEKLNEKYGYNNPEIPEEAKPKFDDPVKPPTKEELQKKLREKLKHLNKRRSKVEKKTLI